MYKFSYIFHTNPCINSNKEEKKWGKAKKIDCKNSMLKSRDRTGFDIENDCHLYWRKVTLRMNSEHQHLDVELLSQGAGDNGDRILFT